MNQDNLGAIEVENILDEVEGKVTESISVGNHNLCRVQEILVSLDTKRNKKAKPTSVTKPQLECSSRVLRPGHSAGAREVEEEVEEGRRRGAEILVGLERTWLMS